MAGEGYRYASPLDRTGFDLDHPAVSPSEIATAQADVTCKQQTQLVSVWFHAEVEYQRKWIEQHAEEFHEVKATHELVMRIATEVTDGTRHVAPAFLLAGMRRSHRVA
jgi:hypothetical protein